MKPKLDTSNQVRAEAKWVRMPARKARVVADTIRGRSVPEARTVLAFTPRAAAREYDSVLRSAVANAEANHGLIGDELFVAAVYADEGPTMKRWRARARGRVARIGKRTCHLTVVLAAPLPDPSNNRPRKERAAASTGDAGASAPRAKRSRRKEATA
jgi:large subunit ribosomal protein L22